MCFLYRKTNENGNKKAFLLGMLLSYKKKTADGYVDRRLFGLWKAEKKNYVTTYFIRGIRIRKKVDYASMIQEKCNDLLSSLSLTKNSKSYFFPELTDDICCYAQKEQTARVFIDENIDKKLHQELIEKYCPDYDPDKMIELALKRFIFNHDKYLRNRLPSEPERRLFVISGTLSLINALCYIKENTGVYEDFAVVCGAYFPKFIEDTLQILSIHNFKKIFFAKKNENIKEVLIFNNLYKVDELIHITYIPVLNAIKDVFKSKIKKNIVLEYMPILSFNGLFNKDDYKIFSLNYFNKIDCSYPEAGYNYTYMKKETLESVLSSLQKSLNAQINLDKNKKNILFCGGSLIKKDENLSNIHVYCTHFQK